MYGTLMLVAGSAIRSYSQMYGASQAIKQGKYQQDILNYQSKYLEAAQAIEEERIRRDVRKVISSQRAATAASGFAGGIGTELDLETSAEIQADIDIALLRQSGSIEQLRLNTQGHMARSEGYGIAAGLSGGVTAGALDTLLSVGSRHGWFKKKK